MSNAVQPFALGTGYKRPMDLDFGPDGALYVIEWGSGFGGDNADSGVYRVDYVAGDKAPTATASASVTSGLAPLAVNFSSAGSRTPRRGPLTYAWDFTSDGTTDSTAANPSFTYTANGAYTAKLTVKDQTGLTAVANVQISVGNRAPTVTIETPLDGQVASFTDKIPYKISDHRSGGRQRPARASTATTSRSRSRSATTSTRTTCRARPDARAPCPPGSRPVTAPRPTRSRSSRSAYTDKGGSGGVAPLTGRAQAILQPKTEAGGVLRLHRPHRRTARPAAPPACTTETTTDVEGGGLEPRLHRGRRLRLLQAGQPQGRHRDALPRGLGRRGRQDRGPLRARPPARSSGTTDTITPTGGWQTFKDVQLNLTNPPTGHAPSCSSCSATPGSTQLAAEPQLDRVRRQGRRGHGLPRGHVHDHARQRRHRSGGDQVRRHGDRRRRRHAHLRVGLRRPRHDDGHLDRRGPDVHLRQRRHLHGHVDRQRRPGRHHDEDRLGDRHRALGLRQRLQGRLQRRGPRFRLGRHPA